jgi:hypothetical protein
MKRSAEGGSREKATWLKVEPGKTEEIRFLQEIDADSPNYSEKNGLVLAASEHSDPENYRLKAVCSLEDEGKCYGCERNAQDPKAGWRARTRLYANVLVGTPGSKDAHVAILSQGFSGRSITPNLLQAAEAYQGVSKTVFKISRMGSGTDTTYSLFPFGQDEAFNAEDFELYDLSKVAVRQVPYAEQAAFFNPTSEGGSEPTVDDSNVW